MKKIILSLFIGFVGIISFCNAGDYYLEEMDRYTSSQGGRPFEVVNNYDMVCLRSVSCFNIDEMFISFSIPPDYGQYRALASYDSLDGLGICTNSNIYIYNGADNSCSYELTFYNYSGTYIDTNYCVGNGLCPNECGSGSDLSGDLQYSNIYINSILHPGKQNIFIDIPDYITRDYSSVGDDFNVYVGSGYDVDYINSIIDINSYRPTSTDFTDIFVGGLTLITPYIVAVLFFYLVWRLLKKIFS